MSRKLFPVVERQTQPCTRGQSPPLRLLVRLLWTVTPAACVAGKLPADAARRSPQSPSNLSQSMSFLTPTVDVKEGGGAILLIQHRASQACEIHLMKSLVQTNVKMAYLRNVRKRSQVKLV